MRENFILTDSSNRELFEQIGNYLETELRLKPLAKLSGTDQFYWDYKVDNIQLTLHLEHYSGISIYPAKSSQPAAEELKIVHFVADLIKKKFRL
jgi:hypothetical protein